MFEVRRTKDNAKAQEKKKINAAELRLGTSGAQKRA
jgi:hypothetical protein